MPQKEIEQNAKDYMEISSSIRYGQSLMIGLFVDSPDIYNQITGTDADPFHDDDRLPAFWAKYKELTSQ